MMNTFDIHSEWRVLDMVIIQGHEFTSQHYLHCMYFRFNGFIRYSKSTICIGGINRGIKGNDLDSETMKKKEKGRDI